MTALKFDCVKGRWTQRRNALDEQAIHEQVIHEQALHQVKLRLAQSKFIAELFEKFVAQQWMRLSAHREDHIDRR